MRSERELLRINREFYDTFAEEYSLSRAAINPGIQRTLAMLDQSAVLDAGCGDGRASRILPRHCRYVGIDFSAKLIGRAALTPGPQFILADLSAPLPVAPRSFPSIVCYAVLHHLPEPARLPLLQSLARTLTPRGRLALSAWQFLHTERMRRKIANDLGGGDYLLHWKRGGRSLRYVHHFDEEEIKRLAREASLSILELFYSDGCSGDLSLYAIMEAGAKARPPEEQPPALDRGGRRVPHAVES